VAVLVLGAHRSGTSVTTGLLARLGFALPRTLIPADSWNAEGYFESSRLGMFHDRLLRAAGTSWDSYTRVNPEWLASDEARTLREECRELLRSEFGDVTRCVVKDPRICRFVPFWLQLLQEEGIQAKAVLVVRPPFDVARSLRARDGLRLALGALVWLRHVLDAEVATRSIPRTWAPYDDTLRDWRNAARRIGADLGEAWLEHAAADAPDDGLVNTNLHHHSGSIDTSRVPNLLIEWVRRTEDALASCAAGSPDRLRAEGALDAIRTEFDRTTAPFGEAEEPRYLEWMDTAGARQAERDVLAGERDALRADLNRVLADRDRLRAEYNRVNADRSDLAQRLQLLEANAETTRRDLSAAIAGLDASRLEIQALRTSMSWRVTAPLRAVYRLVKQPAAD
jgi:hypothetical protein